LILSHQQLKLVHVWFGGGAAKRASNKPLLWK